MGLKRDTRKQKIIDQLRLMPNQTVACRRAGVSTATYYRWLKDDAGFENSCHEALSEGVLFVNDLAESKVIEGIKAGIPIFIMAWLNNHHPSYGNERKRRQRDDEGEYKLKYEKLMAAKERWYSDFLDKPDEYLPADEK